MIDEMSPSQILSTTALPFNTVAVFWVTPSITRPMLSTSSSYLRSPPYASWGLLTPYKKPRGGFCHNSTAGKAHSLHILYQFPGPHTVPLNPAKSDA